MSSLHSVYYDYFWGMSKDSDTKSKAIFLTGVGRSGTTLLQSMLNAHPCICFAPETHFVKNYIVPSLSQKKKYNKQQLKKQLANDKAIQRLSIDWETILNQQPIDKKEDVILFFKNLFATYIEKFNKPHFGDKDPMNAPYIPHIKKAFHYAYLIHIIRDPRDVILSRIKSDWGKNTPFFKHVAEYQSHLRKALKDGKRYFGNHYIEVFYEELLNNPAQELKRICNGLEIDYSDEMMNYHQKSDQIVFGDEKSWKQNVFKPVIKENVQKWKKELSLTQIAKIEGGIEDLMLQLGYKLNTKGFWFQKNILSIPIKLASIAYQLKNNKDIIK